MNRRKHQALDVVNMWSTLTRDHWRTCLETAVQKGSINKLIAWRYGLQAGLSDAVKKGFKNDKLDLWVMKRIRDLEKAMRIILKRKHPMPGDQVISKTNKGQRIDFAEDAKAAKRRRDREFERFLMESNF